MKTIETSVLEKRIAGKKILVDTNIIIYLVSIQKCPFFRNENYNQAQQNCYSL